MISINYSHTAKRLKQFRATTISISITQALFCVLERLDKRSKTFLWICDFFLCTICNKLLHLTAFLFSNLKRSQKENERIVKFQLGIICFKIILKKKTLHITIRKLWRGRLKWKETKMFLFLARAGSWNALPAGYELIPGIGGRKPQRGAASCEALGSLGVHSRRRQVLSLSLACNVNCFIFPHASVMLCCLKKGSEN